MVAPWGCDAECGSRRGCVSECGSGGAYAAGLAAEGCAAVVAARGCAAECGRQGGCTAEEAAEGCAAAVAAKGCKLRCAEKRIVRWDVDEFHMVGWLVELTGKSAFF